MVCCIYAIRPPITAINVHSHEAESIAVNVAKPLEIADAVTVTVAEPIGAPVRVVKGPVPAVELIAALSWLFKGDMTLSMTCIKPLFVLEFVNTSHHNLVTTHSHHILVYDFGIVYKDVVTTNCDSDRLVTESGICLSVCQEIRIQRFDNRVEFD